MIRVGLTGGIGSGKSTVAKIFEVLNIPVYYADSAAKILMNTDPIVKEDIIRHFGADSYTDGRLNRSYLATIVFNDPVKLQLLNSLTHPATIRDAEKWMQRQTTPYAIKEAALLFESGSASQLDHIIGVSAPLSLRIQRTIDRDHISKEEVLQRIARQMDDNEKMKKCDSIVVNNEEMMLIPQVLTLHKKLLGY